MGEDEGLGLASGFTGPGVMGGDMGYRFGRSMDLGGSGGGVTLSRQVVGTIGTVLLWTCLLLLLLSSEFCRTRGGWFSCLLFCLVRKFLRLCPVKLLSDLGRPLRKLVALGGGEPALDLSKLVLVRVRRGVVGATSDSAGYNDVNYEA